MTTEEELEAYRRSLRHELRTPVNHILSFAQLLREDAEDAGQAAIVQELGAIDRDGRLALAMVSRILDEDEGGGAALVERVGGLHELMAGIEERVARLKEAPAFENAAESIEDLDRIARGAERLDRLSQELIQQLGIEGPTREMPSVATGALDDEGLSAAPAEPDASAVNSSGPGLTDTTMKGRILVVDDNELNREALVRMLQRLGHSTCLAANGREALDMLASESVDAVLLDIMMPEMDGYEVLRRRQQSQTLRDIPVVVISALDELSSVVQCIELGAEDYLPKPFNPTLLRARLGATLARKRGRDLEKAYLRQELALRQSEKLATLGKLSAGVAHELNNPAAAVQRSSAHLGPAIAAAQAGERALALLDLQDADRDSLEELRRRVGERVGQHLVLSPLERSDRETAIEDWLAGHGVSDGWDLAPLLVDFGADETELDFLNDRFGPHRLDSVLKWLGATAAVYDLAAEINSAVGRLVEIVRALKSYSYMDQAPLQDVDIHEGLNSTLVILRSKLKDGIAVEREYEPGLPRIQAYGSELNQVWTNLIDNAADAMGGQGRLTVRTRRADPWLIVEIEDSGPGIPESALAQIFDPFFTTKPPGQGTGLGLSISHSIIVERHQGRIGAESEPGHTRMTIALPLNPPAPREHPDAEPS